jgi:hypothetical protein
MSTSPTPGSCPSASTCSPSASSSAPSSAATTTASPAGHRGSPTALRPRAWAVHALPLAAAILGTEKILRLWRPETTDHLEVDAEPEDATPAADEPAVALATVTAVRRPAAPKPTPTKKSTAGLDLEVVAKVRTALAEMGVAATDAKRDDVLAHLRRGGPAPHVSKVGPALRHLRENPDA